MNKLISHLITKIISFFQGFTQKSVAALILASWLLMTSNVSATQDTQPSGEEMLQRIRQHDQKSERPKTTGEFLDEARGDIPLNERMKNITRDSAEAFDDLGKNVAEGVENQVKSITE